MLDQSQDNSWSRCARHLRRLKARQAPSPNFNYRCQRDDAPRLEDRAELASRDAHRGEGMNMEAAKRIAAVTGGTGGLGQMICRRLAGEGFSVVALHTASNDRVQAWLASQEAQGWRFGAVEVDVASFASCAQAANAIRERYGPVSVLVNNAGITRDASFRKMTPRDWDTVLRTNLDSMFNMTRQVVEDMLSLGWGRIVNISSVNGQRGAFGQANYAASKAHPRLHQVAGIGVREEEHHREHRVARLPAHAHGGEGAGPGDAGTHPAGDSARTPGRPRRGGAARRLPRFGARGLHYRGQPFDQRRAAHVLKQ
jgi:NADP-dependent 3-hydroxy acid dehydrogenase YdfG